MIRDEDVERMMSYVEDGDKETLTAMLAGMGEVDRAYMGGYVDGYVEGARHMLTAVREDQTSTNARS